MSIIHMFALRPSLFTSGQFCRKTLIVLSPGFIESFWGIVEFRVAFMEAQVEN